MRAGLGLAAALPGIGAAAPVFESDDQEMLYYWGTTLGEQLDRVPVRDAESIEWIARGMRDRATGQSPRFGDEYPALLNNHLVGRSREAAAAERSAALARVAETARENGAVRRYRRGSMRSLPAGRWRSR